jgi:hypothetical protein
MCVTIKRKFERFLHDIARDTIGIIIKIDDMSYKTKRRNSVDFISIDDVHKK